MAEQGLTSILHSTAMIFDKDMCIYIYLIIYLFIHMYIHIYMSYVYIYHAIKIVCKYLFTIFIYNTWIEMCIYIYNTNIADSSHGPALRISIQQRDCLQVTEPVVWSEEPCCTCWLFLHIYIYIHNIYIPISSMLGYTCPPFSIKSPNCVTAPCIVIAENLEETPIFNVFRRMASCTCTCHQPT